LYAIKLCVSAEGGADAAGAGSDSGQLQCVDGTHGAGAGRSTTAGLRSQHQQRHGPRQVGSHLHVAGRRNLLTERLK